MASCRDCGTGFCIECVRETDQTTLCAECYRRKVSEIARELAPEPEKPAGEIPEETPGKAAEKVGPEPLPRPQAAVSREPAVLPSPLDVGVPPREAPSKKDVAHPAVERKVPRLRPLRRGFILSGRKKKPEDALLEEQDKEEREEIPEIIGEEAEEIVQELEREEALEVIEEEAREAAREEEREEIPEIIGEEAEEGETSAFLAQGPDEDFSQLAEEKPRFRLGRKREKEDAAEEIAAAAEGETSETAVEEPPPRVRPPRAAGARRGRRGPAQAPVTEDLLLEDVVSTLLRPESGEGGLEGVPPQRELAGMSRGAAAADGGLAAGGAMAVPGLAEIKRRRRERRKALGEERAERWAFLAQGRSAEHTIIADSWWRAAAFIVLMLLLGAVLWALPNAYLVPKDTEYGVHAVAIGIVIGLFFWWKAGRKHGTKLAVQAALVTLFSLAIGEFFHWFLIIMKNAAFRTILFDLVSFRFLWENGAEIMRDTVEAMFPGAFIWILVLPALMAFVIGFGMPPIPEVFFRFGRALRE